MTQQSTLGERRRTLISSFFITVLIAVALEHSAEPMFEILKTKGLASATDWLMPFIFLVTTMRFYIGNQLYLREIEEAEGLSPLMWLTDFAFILAESFLAIFMAKLCTLTASATSKMGFFTTVMYLLLMDIVWISFQALSGRVTKNWKRSRVPWGWALLNIATVVVLLVSEEILYKPSGLRVAAVVFGISAIVDVYKMDYYGLLRRPQQAPR